MGKHNKPTMSKRMVKATAVVVGAGAASIGISMGTADAFPGQEGIIKCESGGNPKIVNNTPAGQRAGRPAGLFQIVTSTWRAYGGTQFAPTADLATAAEQQIVADRIYAAQGHRPWECKPSGGSGLSVKGGKAPAAKPKAKAPSAKKQAPAPKAKSKATAKPNRVVVPPGLVKAGSPYDVQPGDSLWKIAKETLGNGNQWHAIYALNKSIIGSNPNMITPEMTLVLPAK